MSRDLTFGPPEAKEPPRGPATSRLVETWQARPARCLLVACSDGRIQAALDAFVRQQANWDIVDRLLVPGGPGALAGSGAEYMRADQMRRECAFIVAAHNIEEILLVQHGPAPDGPPEAVCGDYERKFAGRSPQQIRDIQAADAVEAARLLAVRRSVQVSSFVLDVNAAGAMEITAVGQF